MKTSTQKNIVLKISLLSLVVALAACSPKQRKRQEHEGAKDWGVTTLHTPQQISAMGNSFAQLNLDKFEEDLKRPATEMEQAILVPLARYVLDVQYISTPANISVRLEKAIRIFNSAFWKALTTQPAGLTANAQQEWFRRYENAMMAGCSVDLKRGCINSKLFATDALSARILVRLATQDDVKLEAEMRTHKSPKTCIEASAACRKLVDLRYRRLAMAYTVKNTLLNDSEMSFAFMKYIRLLDYLVLQGGDIGYMSETYTSMFELLISRFKPKDVNSKEIREFIENFVPWTFSSRRSDTFRHGSKAMLNLATQCCLYKDATQFKLSDSMLLAIKESQNESDKDFPSFNEIVNKLHGRSHMNGADILSNLGMAGDLNRLKNVESSFYNEYFFILDRLFNEHLSSGEAMSILERTDASRAQTELLSTLRTYMRVQLAHLTIETIDFMMGIYQSKSIPSGAIFSEAIMVSRDLSTRWMKTQSKLDLLDKFVSSYFKRRAVIPQEFTDTSALMKSFSRNVHYISVYPNMIGMTYFLAKNKGTVKEKSWWGAEFTIQAETVVSDLFDGLYNTQDLWFRFTSDIVRLERERLFYAFHYALKTQALETFTVDEKISGQSDRAKFFELTLGKYLQGQRRFLEDKYMEYERNVLGHASFNALVNICRYELAPLGSVPAAPTTEVELLDLGKFTYVGMGDNKYFDLLKKVYSKESQQTVATIFDDVEPKLTFVRAIIALLENHMLATGEIKSRDEAHPDLENIRNIVREVESRERRFFTTYMKYRKSMFECTKQLYKVEMMRSYRLVQEERAHLGRIHDMLKSVHDVKGVAGQSARLQQLNKEHFSDRAVKFDHLRLEGYSMSQYDFFMRVKKRVEGDIFTQVTDRERQVYGPELVRLVRPRSVRVLVPNGLERMDLSVKSPAEVIQYMPNKEDFIRQGLKHFSGQSGASYAEWQGQGAQLSAFKDYLDTSVDLYLMGQISVEGDKPQSISAGELANIFKDIVQLVNLNDFDVENATIMGLDGRMKVESLEGFLLEPVTMRAQPLLRSLMMRLYERAGLSGGLRGLLSGGHTLFNTLNNEGVIIFDPGPEFQSTLYSVYGKPINRILARLFEFFAKAPEFERDPSFRDLFKTRVRLDENARVVDIESSKGLEPLGVVDNLMLGNLAASHNNFTHKTGNKFNTDYLSRRGQALIKTKNAAEAF